MSTITFEQRQKLQRKITSANDVPVKDVRIDAEDLQALLDIATQYQQCCKQLGEDDEHKQT